LKIAVLRTLFNVQVFDSSRRSIHNKKTLTNRETVKIFPHVNTGYLYPELLPFFPYTYGKPETHVSSVKFILAQRQSKCKKAQTKTEGYAK